MKILASAPMGAGLVHNGLWKIGNSFKMFNDTGLIQADALH